MSEEIKAAKSATAFEFKNFQINRSIFNFKSKYDHIDVNINPSGKIILSENIFELSLEVILLDNEKSELVKINGIATFKYNFDVKDKESIPDVFLVNAPAIAFPYLRAYIAALTALSSKQSITLPIFNLIPLKDTLKKHIILKD